MGIKGLIAALMLVAQHENLYEYFRGKRLGIDASVWLHQIAARHARAFVGEAGTAPIIKDFISGLRLRPHLS